MCQFALWLRNVHGVCGKLREPAEQLRALTPSAQPEPAPSTAPHDGATSGTRPLLFARVAQMVGDLHVIEMGNRDCRMVGCTSLHPLYFSIFTKSGRTSSGAS
jgi:hypothetical protein